MIISRLFVKQRKIILLIKITVTILLVHILSSNKYMARDWVVSAVT